MIHELKIWPQFFEAVKSGNKTFEIRENDRGFQNGDRVILREFDPNIRYELLPTLGDYTGNSISFKIGFVFPVDSTRVVFSLLKDNDDAS